MIKKIILLTICIILFFTVKGQDHALDDYIRLGLENNLALKQKETDYQKSLQLVKQSKSLFYPEISFNARYSAAQGGRTIDLPIGDLFNPVYNSLNEILSEDRFPLIGNQQINFLRPAEHETKLSLVQPLYNSTLGYNHKIKKVLSEVEKIDMDTYKRELVAEIKKAYYNYLKALMLSELLQETKELLEENVRANERLFENEKVTKDNVYRSEAELAKLEKELAFVEQSIHTAQAYVNFLTNQPLESEIIVDEMNEIIPLPRKLEKIRENALNQREELQLLDSYQKVSGLGYKLQKGNKRPNLFLVMDYGFQGEKYRFTGHYDYMLASVVLRWGLFKGFYNKAKIQEAMLEQETLHYKYEEAKEQINLQIINAYYQLEAANKSVKAAEKEVVSAEKAFGIVDKQYREGMVNLLQYMDARNTMTTAKQNLIITRYDYHAKYAEYERVAALYPVK